MALVELWIDRNADTVIILKSPQPDDQFAPWNEDGTAAKFSAMVDAELPFGIQDEEDEEEQDIEEYAVATTLGEIPIDAVPDIPEGSREGHQKTDGYYYVTANGWNAEAFLLLMNMLHLQSEHIPLAPSFETMAKLAVIVDYYDCAKAIDAFTRIYMKRSVRKNKLRKYGRKLILEMFVSLVFKWSKCFEEVTAEAILGCSEETRR
ncbi:hypothetical protein PTT_15674 [Pyrenophora teres f. teres 0-1]|uniref:Uncharacterized protein n=1 Tax=Pyrenophora teres f. teres (strain 0-1) TaxID=861557 RepID=E3S0Q4_PYRTT|nr:hypothetical protein PTT_15674 [Pyrenophora teres f. teres 0-1]